MKKFLSLLVLIGGFSFVAVSADVDIKNCKLENHCVVDKQFTVQVTNIRKRGKFILLQVKYGFLKHGYSINYEGASLIDNKGNEGIIKGEVIAKIKVSSNDIGGFKNVSFKFKAKDFEWGDTFDLEVKADDPHGSVAFFDLKVK